MAHRLVTWEEIKRRIADWDRNKSYYGVPRGGQYIAALLNPAETPESADIIVDDLIDSGATRERWVEQYPGKPFKAVFNKKEEDLPWLQFPWELKGAIEITENVSRIIEYFDDANREGLRQTPFRYIKFLEEFLSPPDFKFTTFKNEGMDQMILVKDIPFYSLCEHHLAPFFGVGHIAYIPNGEIVGLSKLARTLELYSRRFQNQERITTQVAERIQKELNPLGVGVVLKAQHLCMSMRGVKKPNTWTVTSKLIGNFMNNEVKNEFLHFIK